MFNNSTLTLIYPTLFFFFSSFPFFLFACPAFPFSPQSFFFAPVFLDPASSNSEFRSFSSSSLANVVFFLACFGSESSPEAGIIVVGLNSSSWSSSLTPIRFLRVDEDEDEKEEVFSSGALLEFLLYMRFQKFCFFGHRLCRYRINNNT